MSRLRRLRAHVPTGEVLRFAAVGVVATQVQFCVKTHAVEAALQPPDTPNGLAFCAAVAVTYLGQSHWVFRAPQHSLARLQKFLLTALGGLAANIGIMALVVNGLGLPYQVGFVTALLLVPTATFVINKLWVFRPSGAE